MKRYTISTKIKGEYRLPVIKERIFNSPFRFGAYCADDGTLWTSLDDGKNIFKTYDEAYDRLQEIIKELLA
jgi:hypothetical protein